MGARHSFAPHLRADRVFVLIADGSCLLGLRSVRRRFRLVRDVRQQIGEDGIDPDLFMIRGIADIQASARPGRHPVERFRIEDAAAGVETHPMTHSLVGERPLSRPQVTALRP